MVGVADIKIPTAIPMATYRGSPFSALVRLAQCCILDFIFARSGGFMGSIAGFAFIAVIRLLPMAFSIFGTLPIRNPIQFQRPIWRRVPFIQYLDFFTDINYLVRVLGSPFRDLGFQRTPERRTLKLRTFYQGGTHAKKKGESDQL
jgi:hypothetical protein